MKKKTLKRGPWDKEELKDLKRFFPHEATASVAAFLNRSFEATKKRASRMGIFKSPKYLKALGRAVVLVLALCLFAGTARAGQFTLEGAFDYETAEAGFLWWPDPNGGIGITTLMDSHVPGDPEDNIAVGPVVEFNLTGLSDAVIGTIFPGNWKASDLAMGTPFGKLGLLIETGGDHDAVFLAATGVRLLPGRFIQPTLWAEYVKGETGSDIEQDIKFMVGATIWLGK